uniref:RING-type E3 ubiquitin transferase n=2 Tax=Trichobilharzia regenti TaxID=157069 RepID=A0AA85KP24_TRIRE|nr:unnamed protein product [Trichobilharzia regenti]
MYFSILLTYIAPAIKLDLNYSHSFKVDFVCLFSFLNSEFSRKEMLTSSVMTNCSTKQQQQQEDEISAMKWAKLLPVHDSCMHELSQEVITIGSSEECSILVKDENVSASHCMLIKDPDNVIWLYDCSEDKGTRCNNGKWLNQDCISLHNGDYFHLVWDEVDESKRIGFCILLSDDNSQKMDSINDECHDKAKIMKMTTTMMITPVECQTQPSTSSSSSTASTSMSADSEMESCLTCVICGDIYFECCSVQPCLHSFCTLCWLKWQKSECPMCRKHVSAYAKNHQLNDLVEVFLRKYPEKSKSTEEQNEIKEEIRRLATPTNNYQNRRYNRRNRRQRVERYAVTGGIGRNGLLHTGGGGGAAATATSSNISLINVDEITLATTTSSIVNEIITTNNPTSIVNYPMTNDTVIPTMMSSSVYTPFNSSCIFCSWVPPNGRRDQSSSGSGGGSRLAGVGNHVTRDNECSSHCFCACCRRPMPSQTSLHPRGINTIECEICRRTFCSLINPTGCAGCNGYCLSRLQDLTRYTTIPRTLLLNNRIETEILNDYLTSQGISIPRFIEQCLSTFISSTIIYPSLVLSENSLVCTSCGEHVLSELAYKYRVSICADQLPDEVVLKPNCYYGRYCRYQSNNYHHARRFNHICERSF